MSRKLLQLLRDNASRAESDPVIRSEIGDTEAHVYVYDVIDAWYGASAEALTVALNAAAGRLVHLHINSPGGDVFEARAMTAAIVGYSGKVIAHVDGLAASAATTLALAASEVRMLEGSLFMIHNSWTLAWGNKSDLRTTADLLEKIDSQIAADYARRTGKSLEEIAGLMDAETWFTAAEALEAKLVDAIDSNTQAAGSESRAGRWNLSAFANAPAVRTSAQDDAELTAQAEAQRTRNRNRLRLLASI